MTEPSDAVDSASTAAESEEDFDRLEMAFPAGAPDISIAWINVHRATLTELNDVQGPRDDAELQWHVYGMPQDTDEGQATTQMVLFGDLAAQRGDWFLGVTAAVGLLFRGGVTPVDLTDLDDVNRFVRVVGNWSSTVLYDFAAATGRGLVAQNFLCDIELPSLTPKPHFPELEAREELSDGAEERTRS